MATYTMPLMNIIQMYTQNNELMSERERIEVGRKHLFNFKYPFYDEQKRKEFETKFIRKFYTREIGFETEGLFKFELETWLLIRMPYYNQLFRSELIKFDPMRNMIRERRNQKQNDNSRNDDSHKRGTEKTGQKVNTTDDSNNKSRDFSRNVSTDTPDNRLAITTEDGSGVIEYASAIDENLTTSTGESSSKGNTESDTDTVTTDVSDYQSLVHMLEQFNESESGKIGDVSYSKMLLEFRETFLSIEAQIFDEMNCLFMGIY